MLFLNTKGTYLQISHPPRVLIISVLICICLVLLSCRSQSGGVSPKQPISNFLIDYDVEPASAWTKLFYRKSGWFGGDGIFSIGLDGDDQNDGSEKTLLIFSDTYIGEVADGRPLPGNTMVNNTVAYYHGTEPGTEHIQFHYKEGADGSAKTFFVPEDTTAETAQHFWLGDGFVNRALDNQLYIFAYHIQMTGPGVFDFIEPDVSLIALPADSRPPFDAQRHIETPLHITHETLGEGNFGAGILVNTKWTQAPAADGFIYIYACIGQDKNLVAARVRPGEFEDFNQWKYWDGSGWNINLANLKAITNAVSNELSVTPLPDGRYLLVFQVLGLSDKVGLRVGLSPVGPFGPIEEIYRTPEIDEGLLPYNAKAHPALSKPGQLLISYNTITADFWNDIQKDAHIYRPRFIRLIFK